MKLNQTNWFDSDTLIGLQSFFFHEVFPAIIFSIYFLLLFFQSRVTLDVINYHNTSFIKEINNDIVFKHIFKHIFNLNKVDNIYFSLCKLGIWGDQSHRPLALVLNVIYCVLLGCTKYMVNNITIGTVLRFFTYKLKWKEFFFLYYSKNVLIMYTFLF
jgi:hypothetical protein